MADGDISTQAEAQSLAGVGVADDFDLAAEVTNHADKVLKASGSALKHYTTPSAKRAILSAMMDAMEAAYRAGAKFAERLYEDRFTRLTEANAAQAREIEMLRGAVQVLRNGYSDAESGLRYVLQEHGRLSGVGFDRVFDHYAEWVTIPEREGLLAGSHTIAARALTGGPHD